MCAPNVPSAVVGEARRVKFAVGEEAEDAADHVWECFWRVRTAEPVHYMAFSRDGTLFATAGLGDQIVKVWYEKKQGKQRVVVGQGSRG